MLDPKMLGSLWAFWTRDSKYLKIAWLSLRAFWKRKWGD